MNYIVTSSSSKKQNISMNFVQNNLLSFKNMETQIITSSDCCKKLFDDNEDDEDEERENIDPNTK